MDNYEAKLLKMQQQFSILHNFIGGEWQKLPLHEVEEKVFRQVLEIGRIALESCIAKKGTGKDHFNGEIHCHKEQSRKYISIFGDIHFPRAYFWESGLADGICPLDKTLFLPEKHFSYLLQKWNQMIAVESNFDTARENLETIFGINIWSKQSEEINRKAAECVEKYYEDKPVEQQKEPILVAEIDGKGVVMRKDGEEKEKRVRLKKGEKNGLKKMATVTAIFGIERNVRSLEDIIKPELGGDGQNSDKKGGLKQKMTIASATGPEPQNRHLRATLQGKDVAFDRLLDEIGKRDPENKCERIALVDGERGLESKIKELLLGKGFILILDLFHVMERLWKLCYHFCPESSPESATWVRKYLTMILTGKTGYFIGAIRQVLSKNNFGKNKRKEIESLLAYYERRKEYMRYDEYLAKGYPVGSGVIEGACRSFVKDRMELSGMRWSKIGAEAMLELRSIKTNKYWDNYWKYFIREEQGRKYAGHENYLSRYHDFLKEVA